MHRHTILEPLCRWGPKTVPLGEPYYGQLNSTPCGAVSAPFILSAINSPWARRVLISLEWDKIWPNAFWFRGHMKVKKPISYEFVRNHFLGSTRPLNEIPQVGRLSRSGVIKSVLRDGLLGKVQHRLTAIFWYHTYPQMIKWTVLSRQLVWQRATSIVNLQGVWRPLTPDCF